jgi:two-component system, sensor histidine kinase
MTSRATEPPLPPEWQRATPPLARDEPIAEDDLQHDILVVDDDARNLLAIEVALGDLGQRLVKTKSGEEALRRLLEQDFALILLDVQMPTMDGFEVARIIRSRPRTRHVPIIFVTAYGQDEEQSLRGYELGAVDFLFKPIVPEMLRAKVSVFVELQRRTQQVRRQADRLREMERREHNRQLIEERQRWEAQALRMQMKEQVHINRQLEEADRRKDEFLALLGHELRTPLSPIVTGIELLLHQSAPSPKFTETLDKMERQSRHLLRLVDDLLDVSRISSGKLGLSRAPTDARLFLREAIDAVAPLLEQQRHRLEVTLGDSPLWVDGDAVRLAQVFANLLHNAARYTPPGGMIEVACVGKSDAVVLSVRDNGRGIAPEHMDRLFDKFFQERDEGPGLGLGLSLVESLVQLHGGAVTAASEGRGRGSTFEVRLPACTPPEMLRSETDDESPAMPSSGPSPSHLLVALIEDDPDIRELTRALLEQWGHRVVEADTGTQGLELLLNERPDVALVDIGLPDMDGYGVARLVREKLGTESPRLIAVTGFGQQKDRSQAIEAGFDSFLVKPATPEALRDALGLQR